MGPKLFESLKNVLSLFLGLLNPVLEICPRVESDLKSHFGLQNLECCIDQQNANQG
jgi:hypothetical protein